MSVFLCIRLYKKGVVFGVYRVRSREKERSVAGGNCREHKTEPVHEVLEVIKNFLTDIVLIKSYIGSFGVFSPFLYPMSLCSSWWCVKAKGVTVQFDQWAVLGVVKLHVIAIKSWKAGFNISFFIYLVHLAISLQALASLVGSSEIHQISSGVDAKFMPAFSVFIFILFVGLQFMVCCYLIFVLLGPVGYSIVTSLWYLHSGTSSCV